ncbi:MAG: LysR family transcriptional regulator [Rhodospirillales bacterium CG15_BIG_FIL_POST_REV_8_21_14_020_66_15]|nr:MAG: LysR family transcriptional regulator [Rhodospirillales bacterium CG15_BIG_FIL_POST_REV_8_21_14_020_66_15]
MRDWDDLRYFLAVARAGSLSGAAKALGVNHSTAFRRIEALEQRLGVRLFERHRDGYALTLAGDEMLEAAERVDAEVDTMERRVTGRDLRLSGPLAVTTTDTLMAMFLGRSLASFQAAYPGIDLTVLLDSQFFNLSKRQADVAVRPTLEPPEALVGRKVSDLAFAVYGSPDYLARHGRTDDLAAHRWLLPDDSLAHLAAARWQKKALPGVAAAMRSNNLSGLMAGAANGMGVALLPCFMADPAPQLERLTGPIAEAASALWLLTHADLRNTQRVRAFMDHMAAALAGERDLLEGRG